MAKDDLLLALERIAKALERIADAYEQQRKLEEFRGEHCSRSCPCSVRRVQPLEESYLRGWSGCGCIVS